MKRSMPEFRSKSESRTLVLGSLDIATAVFSAIVEVPTPALEGRNEKTWSVASISGGRVSRASLMRSNPSVRVCRSKGSDANSRIPARITSSRICGSQKRLTATIWTPGVFFSTSWAISIAFGVDSVLTKIT